MPLPILGLGAAAATSAELLDKLVSIGKKIALVILVKKILEVVIEIFKKPLGIVFLIFLLTYYPDTIQWILMQIGLIELKIFAIVLAAVLPDVFGQASDLNSWADIWNNALNVLPVDMVEVMAKCNVAEMMALITSTITAAFTIRLYFRIVNRATTAI